MGEAKRRREVGLGPREPKEQGGRCSCGGKLGGGARRLPNGIIICARCYGERNPLGTISLLQRKAKQWDEDNPNKDRPKHLQRIPDHPLHILQRVLRGGRPPSGPRR